MPDLNWSNPKLREKIQSFKVQIYSNYLCGTYAIYRNLRNDSKVVVDMCAKGHKDSYKTALALNTSMQRIDSGIAIEYVKKVGYLIDNYYAQYNKLCVLTQEYVGRIFKNKILAIEKAFG